MSLLFVIQIHPQELSKHLLDSLYTKFLQIRAPELLAQPEQAEEISPGDRKCGFGFANQIKLNFNFFSQEQKNILKPLVERPTLPNSIVSPKQYFRIHYTNTGADAIAYDVNLLAQALDSSYYFEIEYLGYPPPPSDGSEGGDDKYDVYVLNLGNLYGQTWSETNVGISSWTSYIEMDNDFPWYSNAVPPKQPIDAARVTVAHEFHHSIQFGSYAPVEGVSYRSSDTYFYELTSTSMEEFVFDDVNDYYAYMHSYFNSTYYTFPNHIGYDMAIWNIYLVQNYDFEILKRQWELMPDQRAILAIGYSILERSSTFAREYNRFGIWTYYTGYRAIPNSPYFDEAAFYPVVKPLTKIQFNNSYPPINVEAEPTSNNFIQFNITTNGDTLYSIVTNGNISASTLSPSTTFSFAYTLFADVNTGERKLTDDYSANFEVSNPSWWSVSEILNGLLVREDSTIIPGANIVESFVFPNPYKYQGDLSISIEGKQGEDLDLNVYSADLKLVFSSQNPATLLINNTIGIKWDGRDNAGKKLASGVYIYAIKKGEDVIKGKVVIFNE
ncbi:MAG: hypothetical protein OQK52_03180 [Ignavibacteriaceae bacterium]|nr:hypothetical protein [Ignavibacteriaceae bacterium]